MSVLHWLLLGQPICQKWELVRESLFQAAISPEEAEPLHQNVLFLPDTTAKGIFKWEEM